MMKAWGLVSHLLTLVSSQPLVPPTHPEIVQLLAADSVQHAPNDECLQLNQKRPPPGNLSEVRFEWPLKSDSLVVDVGGNAGGDLDKFAKVFQCYIVAFEPNPSFFAQLLQSHADNPKVTVLGFGLGAEDRATNLTLNAAGTTAYDSHPANNKAQAFVPLRDVDAALTEVSRERGIDLLSLNCEGCEYEVLERLVQSNWIDKLPNLQVSWHRFEDKKGKQPKAWGKRKQRRCAVHQALSKTHQLVYYAEYGWEGWTKRKGSTDQQLPIGEVTREKVGVRTYTTNTSTTSSGATITRRVPAEATPSQPMQQEEAVSRPASKQRK